MKGTSPEIRRAMQEDANARGSFEAMQAAGGVKPEETSFETEQGGELVFDEATGEFIKPEAEKLPIVQGVEIIKPKHTPENDASAIAAAKARVEEEFNKLFQ